MIQRFVIGKPFPTESVVLDLPAETGPVPYLTPDGDGWQYVMQEKDIVYGLGEMPRGLNKRGWHYETNNTDESEHGENRLSYYAAHNFLLISPADGSGSPGVFWYYRYATVADKGFLEPWFASGPAPSAA